MASALLRSLPLAARMRVGASVGPKARPWTPWSWSEESNRRHYRYHRDWDKDSYIGQAGTHLHGYSNERQLNVEGVSNKQFPIVVEWERSEHVKRAEMCAEASGDMEEFPIVDPSQRLPDSEGSPALENAIEDVKRLYSMEFADQRQVLKRVSLDFARRVQRHAHDFNSLEVHIALLTARIRQLAAIIKESELLHTQLQVPPPTGPRRHSVKIMVDRRRVLLQRLRSVDYKKFEFVLEQLKITFKPRPIYFERIERDVHMVRLTDLWCSELQEHRLRNLEHKWEKEQPKFLRKKAQSLKWIRSQEMEMGLEPSVTEADISDCLERAAVIEASWQKALEEGHDPKDLEHFVYEEEQPKTEVLKK